MMRLLLAAAFVVSSAPAVAASTQQSPAAQADKCPHTQSYLADQSGLYRGKPLTPKKLTDLPRGTAYMAVYRHIGACEAPLTMVDYRNPRRR
jgi:hypothetical protein